MAFALAPRAQLDHTHHTPARAGNGQRYARLLSSCVQVALISREAVDLARGAPDSTTQCQSKAEPLDGQEYNTQPTTERRLEPHLS
eukprot:scaffold105870_cov33-Tisochrysis_lutea.AAC.1